MDKQEVLQQLSVERKLVVTEGTGNIVRREAWKRIDGLLDVLGEITIVELSSDLREL